MIVKNLAYKIFQLLRMNFSSSGDYGIVGAAEYPESAVGIQRSDIIGHYFLSSRPLDRQASATIQTECNARKGPERVDIL